MNPLAADTPVALVTGSAKRIGKSINKLLHAQGYSVAIHCNSSTKEANQLSDQLNQIRPGSAAVVQANLNNLEELKTLKDSVLAAFGRLDVLVHNASRFYKTPIHALDVSDWDELFGSNAKAPLFLTQLFLDQLSLHHGAVVSILDIHAKDRPFAEYTVYNMAKAAHRMMVKSLSLELAPNIRVNGVAPGANVWPEDTSDQHIQDMEQQKIKSGIPLGRVGEPHEVAEAVLYLIQAKYVTGHVINVDGGRSLTLAGGSLN